MYKSLLIIIGILFFPPTTSAQEVAIELSREALYYGIPTDIKVVVENLPCDSVFLKATHGDLKGEACEYQFSPSRVHYTDFSVFQLSGGDTLLLFERNYKINDFPSPVSTVSGKRGGKASGNLLKRTLGIRCRGPENSTICSHLTQYRVVSYKVMVLRDDLVVFSESNTGKRFSDAFKQACTTFKAGDLVYFIDIKARGIKQTYDASSVVLQIQ